MRIIASLGTACVLCPALIGATPLPPGPPDTTAFEVDLTVERTMLDETGVAYGPPVHPITYRLGRARTASGWRR